MAEESLKKSMYLYDMTWKDVKAALPEIKVAIIPTGSTEQHGPGGTFLVDTGRALEFSKRLAMEVYPHALVTPCVNFGISPHHMHFPGTITLRAETFMNVLWDVTTSLHQHGIRRFLFLNGHGGNNPALTLTINRIRHELDCRAAWASPSAVIRDIIQANVKSPWTGHACEYEISQCLYLCPEAARVSSAEKGEFVEEALAKHIAGFPVEEAKFWEENTLNGALGDARQATEEFGRVMVEAGVERLAGYLRKFMES